ncbi:MAG: CHAP domain-containing protein, partial [Acetobacteraceae bacterium]
MRAREAGGKWLILCSLLTFGWLGSHAAVASPRSHHHHVTHTRRTHRVHHTLSKKVTLRHFSHRHVTKISCVPFARRESGIKVSGNAWEWWENAAGIYARGHTPRLGAVLVFQANRRMPLGHVAVVTWVRNSREIQVDQANWPGGNVEHGVRVIDVSHANDWSAVRVEIGHADSYGSIYPTYGFIYNRAVGTTVVANAHIAPGTIPALNAAPSDLRELPADEELAEAPAEPVHHFRR